MPVSKKQDNRSTNPVRCDKAASNHAKKPTATRPVTAFSTELLSSFMSDFPPVSRRTCASCGPAEIDTVTAAVSRRAFAFACQAGCRKRLP